MRVVAENVLRNINCVLVQNRMQAIVSIPNDGHERASCRFYQNREIIFTETRTVLKTVILYADGNLL